MRTVSITIAGLTIACAAVPASAQSTLDRVDPARVEDRTLEKIPDERDAVVPLIDNAPVRDIYDSAFTIGAIDITGIQTMSRADFADIVEDHIGRTLTSSELAELVERLAARARERYPLASAAIEPQTMRAGVLRVRIDEGRIDSIRLDGPENRAVLAALKPLASGTPITREQLERRLLVAGDIDGVSLGEARIVREDGLNILLVEIDYRSFRAQVTLDNDSTKPIGPLELFGSARFNGLLSDDDTLQVFALGTVPDIGELTFARLRYGKRINPSGTEIIATGSYARSAPGAYLESLDIEGESWLASIGLLHPLWRSRRTSIWIDAAFSHREVKQDRADALVRKDRLTVARTGIYGYSQILGGRLRVNASLSQGLDLLGATEIGDPLSSREDADGTFTTVTVFADWTKTIIGDFSLNLALRTQLSSQPLLISEEIGIGGASFVRGYDYSERTGDQGTMAYGELNYEWDREIGPLDGLEIYGFLDGGKVTNFDDGFGSGTLFSTGAGLRADVDRRTDAGLEVAVPLSGERFDTDDKSPNVRFSITRHF